MISLGCNDWNRVDSLPSTPSLPGFKNLVMTIQSPHDSVGYQHRDLARLTEKFNLSFPC